MCLMSPGGRFTRELGIIGFFSFLKTKSVHNKLLHLALAFEDRTMYILLKSDSMM
jgi:hypothetical protein